MSIKEQEKTIGKALWHQITTVVILQENMRYKACTTEDISFLHTRIASDLPHRPKLAQKRFRNISIITAWNAHKDQINILGSERFAKETGQMLNTFYSKDQWF
jgi:hypothetical protein